MQNKGLLLAHGACLNVLFWVLTALEAPSAMAVPIFAERYGVSCQTCHTVVPRLNPFGENFRDAGFRWPAAVKLRPSSPVAVKVNLAYTSANDPTGLPKALVDEVELLTMGTAG